MALKRTKKKKQRRVVGSPVKSLRGLEVAYQRTLNKLGLAMVQTVKEEIFPFLKTNQSQYVIDRAGDFSFKQIMDQYNSMALTDEQYKLPEQYIKARDEKVLSLRKITNDSFSKDGFATNLLSLFQRINKRFTGATTLTFADLTASQVVNKVSQTNQKKFERSIKGATKLEGVNLGGIISSEGLENFMEMSIAQNAGLITTLPEEYLKQVEVIVSNGVQSGARFSTIANEITAATGSANSKLKNRIKTIARNEVQTINAQLTLRRSDALGITRGIYRDSDDQKVRPCHEELDGVEYDLKKGAWSKTCKKFIQPGITDINCRCSYSPVINLD